MELGMEKLGAQALMVTLDEVQPHRISLKSRVVLESPRARMLSQYLCGSEIPDSAHIVHEVQIRDRNGEMQRVQALIDCGATSICMAPRLLKRLGISHEAAHITTLGLIGRVIQQAKDSRKMRITVQYLDSLAPVDESDVLVVPMRAYDLVLGLPWSQKINPDIDWAHRRLTSLRSPSASGVKEMTPMTTAVASKVSEAKNKNVNDQLLGRGPDIQTLGSTVFDDLLASDEVVAAFALRIGECPGLRGATLEDITLDSPGNPDRSAGCDEQEAAAVVAAAELLRGDAWMTATSSPRPEGSDWTAVLGSFVGEPLTTRPPGLFLPSFFSLLPCSRTLKVTRSRSSRQTSTYRRREIHPCNGLGIRGRL
jgi:hypothetical protein